MKLCGAVEFDRTHPLTLELAAAMGWTEGQVEDLWRQAATL
jgi:hypothetical protein